MTKQSAFGTLFYLGTRQVETQTITGGANHAGNITVTVTASGLAGSPLDVVVDVGAGDSADTVAQKIRTHLLATAAITALFEVGGTGAVVSLTKLLPAANDASLAFGFVDTGTTDATAGASTDAVAGAAFVSVAAVKNISGPGLKLDTEDVTSHDSTGGWEEVVGTVLREGEVKLELVYDPADDTHDATATGGLGYALKNKLLKHFKVLWPDAVYWTFPGYVAGFEPEAAADGAIKATVSIKVAGAPVLA